MNIARKGDQLCKLFLYSPIINVLIQTSTSPYFGLYLQVLDPSSYMTFMKYVGEFSNFGLEDFKKNIYMSQNYMN